jgi:hypothetical protein
VKREGQVSSGVVSAGKLSGMICTRFFLVGIAMVGWVINWWHSSELDRFLLEEG